MRLHFHGAVRALRKHRLWLQDMRTKTLAEGEMETVPVWVINETLAKLDEEEAEIIDALDILTREVERRGDRVNTRKRAITRAMVAAE